MTFTKFPLAAAAVSMLALAACEAPVPGQTNDNARNGALLGAGVGAVAGALTGDNGDDRLRNAAIGAAIGGSLGGVAGNNLDRQEAELRQQLGGNVGIVNNGTNLTVTLPQDILFATDSATLSNSQQSDLIAIASSLNSYPNTTVNVIGHTDSDGASAYNLDLSQRRAQSVVNVLTRAGVSPVRLVAIGRGEDQPVASNLTAEGKALNRRVVIVITPNA